MVVGSSSFDSTREEMRLLTVFPLAYRGGCEGSKYLLYSTVAADAGQSVLPYLPIVHLELGLVLPFRFPQNDSWVTIPIIPGMPPRSDVKSYDNPPLKASTRTGTVTSRYKIPTSLHQAHKCISYAESWTSGFRSCTEQSFCSPST